MNSDKAEPAATACVGLAFAWTKKAPRQRTMLFLSIRLQLPKHSSYRASIRLD
jgi:hypothetical protein